MFKQTLRTLLLITLVMLGGCATVPGEPVAHDPWEGFNRSIYSFNEGVDRAVLKPVAEGYRAITPDVVETGVSNFLSNLGDILVIINDVLQLKVVQAAQDASRFFLNTTVGVFGIFDVATPIGLKKHDEDFGQTLGYWGVESGPYLVLPFLGPSTVRDTGGIVVDYSISPLRDELDDDENTALTVANVVDTRAKLLKAEAVLDAAVIGDKYSYVRDAWLARRANKVHDGNPPVDDSEIDELDELDELDQLD